MLFGGKSLIKPKRYPFATKYAKIAYSKMNRSTLNASAAFAELLRDFNETLRTKWAASPDVRTEALRLIQSCGETNLASKEDRNRRLVRQINRKFRLNAEPLRKILDAAARCRIFPNLHEKNLINDALDGGDYGAFKGWASSTGMETELLKLFAPLKPEETLDRFQNILIRPKVNRSDAKQRTVSESQNDILRSLLGALVFESFPVHLVHQYFDDSCGQDYRPCYFEHLLAHHPELLRREYALSFLTINTALQGADCYESLLGKICGFVARTYEELDNHSYLAIKLDPIGQGDDSWQWRLYGDVVLFAEKHRNIKLSKGFFRPERVSSKTVSYIPGIDTHACRFDIAQEGFVYKDCFVISEDNIDKAGVHYGPVTLLILFEKNQRDERILPCPSCRSKNVSGNSYPALGVKSWECRNAICPERSAFDRGNRYSLQQLLRQQAILDQRNLISKDSLTHWKLDVLNGTDLNDIADMLVRHFSLAGDTVRFINYQGTELPGLERRIECVDFAQPSTSAYAEFASGPFFARFMVSSTVAHPKPVREFETNQPGVRVIQGDSGYVLEGMQPNFFDGAVTSPPYYNARDYSTWPNVYCYLYDMFRISRSVYHALKPGSYYLFNIFDYFDNEKIIVDSAMGNKRMILGAYMVHIFSSIGFNIQGNIAWFKGEIEGKRNYNQGNNSPFYQLPLNAWEHVLILRKPGAGPRLSFPSVLRAMPVMKMVRGVNVLGHTAPFPEEIPNVLLSQLSEGALVLDPFGGSMTTCRVATKLGLRSVGVDLHSDYCELGIKLLGQDLEAFQPSLSF